MPLQAPPVRYDLIKLQGGLDQVTPMLSLPPGICRQASNFEHSINGGYTRIAGYDRYDGRANPSDATYILLALSTVAAVAVGNTIHGVSSTASGKIIAIDGLLIAITRVSGTFVIGENITVGVSPTVVAEVADFPALSANAELDAQYRLLAANDYRADITAVPGSGSVLGVAFYTGVVYAWRNNASGTAAEMYKSTAGGWVKVDLGYELAFDTGTAEIKDNDVVTGATSAATGTVKRVVLESGTWAGGDAKGRLIFAAVTGAFQNNETLRVSAAAKALADGTQAAITLAKDGRVQTTVANFGGGGSVSKKLYGCDGKNRAFEFDGTTYVPIATGMLPDTPARIAFHKQHLFLAFNHSLQFSSLGEPYQWSPLTGAGELAMNDIITNLIVMPGDQSTGALGVYTRSDTSVLYGTNSGNFQLTNFNTGTGAIGYTAQVLDQAYVLDDRGVIGLSATLNYGNFTPAALTMNLTPFVQIRRNLATASVVNREKSQYRVFFSDGTGLYLTIRNGKFLGAMPVQFSHPVTCAVEGEKPDGSETSFFGSTNGYVYRLDAGTSFDGGVIPASFNLVINSIGSPRVLKRYRKASVEMTGDSYASFAFGYDLGYRSAYIEQPADGDVANNLRAGFNWDGFTWDNFVWDGSNVSPSEVDVNGTAENIAVRFTSVSNLWQPFTVNSVILHYTPRRGLR
jgi:hypothetical protein